MADFSELFQKAKNIAGIAVDKTRDAANVAVDKTKDAAARAKINMAIAGEEREIEKTYRAIGEWFINEYEGELPEGVRDLAGAVAAAKERIAALEAEKPAKEEEPADVETTGEVVPPVKTCPVCGAESAGQFCPMCGAPME